ncbi:MAG TPA: hypothetical protein C5S50_04035 [Methanosarcinaceae archaeon]|nr:hypothetical protein [Methanosarcinaceae archaeon]
MNLRNQMSGTVPDSLLHLTPKRFDIIGDVAVISIPPELDDFKLRYIIFRNNIWFCAVFSLYCTKITNFVQYSA